jgi:prolipoprotein diacylglyceryl transferase
LTVFITWDVDPEIFGAGFFSLRWYGLLFVTAFVLGYFIMRKMFVQEGVPLKTLDRLTWYMGLGTFVGARLGHCLFYEPEYFLQHPLEILLPIASNIDGTYQFTGYQGLASHGAALGILAALYIFSRVEHRPYLWILDRIVIVVALSGFFIRMGNLMNSEIFGHPTGLPWGFEFVRSPEWYRSPIFAKPCHPTQIYEALSYLAIFVWLCRMYFSRTVEKPYPSGILLGTFLAALFTVRFLIEFLKQNQVDFESGMLLNMGQWLSIPFVIFGVYLLLRKRKVDHSDIRANA